MWQTTFRVAPPQQAQRQGIRGGAPRFPVCITIAEAAVLLNFQTAGADPRTFTLFHDPLAGLVLIHRQGQTVARHALPGPLPWQGTTGRLSVSFDVAAATWQMKLELLGASDQPVFTSTGQNPLPIRVADLQGLSQGAARAARHPAVLWFGLTRGAPGRGGPGAGQSLVHAFAQM